jgi:hypothetical protein
VKWKISNDSIKRTVTFAIEDGEPLEARAWRFDQDYQIKPDTAVVTVVDGERRGVTVAGPRLLKGDRTSGVKRGRAEWNHTDVSLAPAWVRELWLQVTP